MDICSLLMVGFFIGICLELFKKLMITLACFICKQVKNGKGEKHDP